MAKAKNNQTLASSSAIAAIAAGTPERPTVSLSDMAKARAAANAEAISRKEAAFDKLAEAKAAFDNAGTMSEAAQAVADEATSLLYQDLASGRIARNEVQAKLVDIFGARPKRDGTPGKTPAGPGEDIRKRINRAAEVAIFVNNPDDERLPAYFQAFPAGSLDGLAASFTAGEIGSFRLWNKLAEVRRELSDGPTPLHLNPERLLDLSDAIERDARIIGSDPVLVEAFVALQAAMDTVHPVETDETDDNDETGETGDNDETVETDETVEA